MMSPNRQRIAQLETLVHKLGWNDAFGCYTRPGFEHMIWPQIQARAKWIVYFDVDGMHALNESFGNYESVDAMVRQVLSVVRSTDYIAGQWKSGDEFLICLTENEDRPGPQPEGLRDRLIQEFAKVGMAATFVIVPVKSTDLVENVEPAVHLVHALKKEKRIGR